MTTVKQVVHFSLWRLQSIATFSNPEWTKQVYYACKRRLKWI